MTKLISLSVPLTAFKRTLSHHPRWPPPPIPPIAPLLSSGRVRKEQSANTFWHFTDIATRIPPLSLPFISPRHPISLFILPSGSKREAEAFQLERCNDSRAEPSVTKEILQTLDCVPNNILHDSSSAVCVL